VSVKMAKPDAEATPDASQRIHVGTIRIRAGMNTTRSRLWLPTCPNPSAFESS
jgi:hypothetical protein